MVFLVNACLSRKKNSGKLKRHFMYQHWNSKVSIIQEGPELLPRCNIYGIHMPDTRLIKHRHKKRCNKVMKMRLRLRDVDMVERCV